MAPALEHYRHRPSRKAHTGGVVVCALARFCKFCIFPFSSSLIGTIASWLGGRSPTENRVGSIGRISRGRNPVVRGPRLGSVGRDSSSKTRPTRQRGCRHRSRRHVTGFPCFLCLCVVSCMALEPWVPFWVIYRMPLSHSGTRSFSGIFLSTPLGVKGNSNWLISPTQLKS
jgi:hypothetical protein